MISGRGRGSSAVRIWMGVALFLTGCGGAANGPDASADDAGGTTNPDARQDDSSGTDAGDTGSSDGPGGDSPGMTAMDTSGGDASGNTDMDAPGSDVLGSMDGPGGDAPGSLDGPGADVLDVDGPGGDALGTCSGPYVDAGYSAVCISAQALVTCQAGPGSDVSCISDTLSCGVTSEYGCLNNCAPDEYAALCTLFDSSMPDGGGPFTNPGCHAPTGSYQSLSSERYFCCACP